MTKIKSKKIMLVLLMGIIACLASLFICFGQNAYADEDEFSDEKAGYVVIDPEKGEESVKVDFDSAQKLTELCNNTYKESEHIEIYLERDLFFYNYTLHVNKGRIFDFNFKNHKIYNDYQAYAFFLVNGTLNLNGDPNNHGIIETLKGADNASVISDNGHVTANNIDFISHFTEDNIFPRYASHLYFTNMVGESEITNCKFSGGWAEYGASVYFRNSVDNKNSSVHFKECDFENCFARRQGGAIYNQGDNVALKLDNSTFHWCSSRDEGGAILAYGKYQECLFNHVTFDSCYSQTEKGGAIYLDGISKDQTFNNCTFIKDTAQYGGAVYINNYKEKDKTLKFVKCVFDGCKVGKDGGAIYNNSEHVNLEFNDTNFANCSSKEKGGAIATISDYENTTFDNCTIDKCSANKGGAIYNYSKHCIYKFCLTNITNCSSKKEGGAIFSSQDYESYYFFHATIDSCHADNDGGAIYVTSNKATIVGSTCEQLPPCLNCNTRLYNTSTISNCTSNTDGGAIYTSAAVNCGNDVTIWNLDFKDNHADSDGGAIKTCGINNYIYKCYFEHNSSNEEGGAIFGKKNFYTPYGCALMVENCDFYNNKADKGYSTMYSTRWDVHKHSENNIIYYKDDYNPEKEFNWVSDNNGFTAVRI